MPTTQRDDEPKGLDPLLMSVVKPDQDAVLAPAVDAGADDEELLGAVARADRGAFEILYHRHAPGLYAFLRRTVDDPDLAQQVVQDTFLAVWRKPSFSGRSSVRTWIYAIAVRRQRDVTRRRRLRLLHTAVERVDQASGPEEAAIARAGVAELARVVGALPVAQRQVLYLAFVEDLAHPEIAEVLGVPLGTVKSRLDGARRSLRVLMHTDGDTGHG